MKKEELPMLPNDPVILLSYINTQLRDNYSSLEDLCRSLDADQDTIQQKLEMINYYYNKEQNQFI